MALNQNIKTMAQCISPYQLKTGIPVPCGKCYECTARKVSSWSFRLMKEMEISSSAYFITLTYNPESIPMTVKGFMSLNKIDYQNFIRELRRVNPEKLKYYTCGEYGGKSWRPHYHAIIFNLDLSTLIDQAQVVKKQPETYLNGAFQFDSPLWPLGRITIGQVSEASTGYTLKYISKPSRVPLHQNDDRIPEFALMSKKLGANYLTQAMREWHEADLLNRAYTPLKDGKKIALPRYYKEKIYSQSDRELIADHMRKKVLEEYQACTNDEKITKDSLEYTTSVGKFNKSKKDARIKLVL